MRFAYRLTILGVVFIAMFSVIGLRLWFVQVAEGPTLAQAAEELTWIKQATPAARGDIYDRDMNLLATSRLTPAVIVDRTFVQPEQRDELVQQLAVVLGLNPSDIDDMYEKAGTNGRFEVSTVSPETALQVTESLDLLPGVEIVNVPERIYITGPTMAHAIGHLGLPSAADLEENPDLDPNLRIGKLGVESVYDEYLLGTPGTVEYRVRGGRIIALRDPVDPRPGDSLVLNLDLDLQQVVELALQEGVALSNSVKDADRAEGKEVFSVTERAAAVVLDVNTFEVLAMASFPNFDPELFVSGIDEATFNSLTETFAFNNLAVSGLYPPASTFKAITYTAIQEENLPFPEDIEGIDPDARTVHCDGQLVMPDLADGSPQVKTDWYNPRDFGWLNIHDSLRQSCNIFFWSAALGTWQRFKETDNENIIQDWAKSLGYGEPTGVDLTGEAGGVVPTRELFEEWAAYQRENPDEPPRLDSSRLELASPFLGGDLMDFAIGQGNFSSTPLQVAVSYAALVNGGTVKEPRIVKHVIDNDGEIIFTPEARLVRKIDISEATRQSLLTDLNQVVTRGTASTAFQAFGDGLDNVGGKTGTGQSTKTADNHAWFVGVTRINNPKYVVAVVIDQGGSGGQIAAPVARHIMQYLMGNEPTPIVEGQEAQ